MKNHTTVHQCFLKFSVINFEASSVPSICCHKVSHARVTWAGPRGSWTREQEAVEKSQGWLIDEDYLLCKCSCPFCGADGFRWPWFVELSNSPHEWMDVYTRKDEHTRRRHKERKNTHSRMPNGHVQNAPSSQDDQMHKKGDVNPKHKVWIPLWGGEMIRHAY